MSGFSFTTDLTPTCDEVVSAMLSGHPLGQPVSTRAVLADFRHAAPARMDSDEMVIASIVSVATGRTMSVIFDQRDVADQPSLSWLAPDVHG